MRKTGLIFLVTIVVLVTYSCNSSKSDKALSGSGIIADSLFNTSFDVRSYNLGMAREEFDLGDDSSILENEKDLIVESINLKTTDSIFAECSYHFEQNLFQSSEINIFSPSDSINKMVSDTLQKRLNKRYGQSMQSRGFYTWKAKSKKGYTLEIFLGDVSYELGSAVTQIQIHADLIEKPMLALKTTELPR
jgi:hypothetical protein